MLATPAVPSTVDLDRAAEELSRSARELAPAIETKRRLPDELVTRLRASGLFRAGAPASLGAAEAPPPVTLRCAESVARGDASVGWCVSIAITSSLLESAVKPINQWVKGSAKFWSEAGSEAVLQRRADQLSDGEPLAAFWGRRQATATGQRRYRRPA